MSEGVQRNGQTDGHTYPRMELTTDTPRRRSWTLADQARIALPQVSRTRKTQDVRDHKGLNAKLGESAWKGDTGYVVYGEPFGRGR